MTSTFSSLYRRGAAFLTPNGSSQNLNSTNGFSTAREGSLFSKVDPAIDGEDCDHDCTSCEVRLPAKWSIDEDEKLYGHVKGWATHMLVATGKTDWVRDVEDEKGSVMEAVGKSGIKPKNGRLMLSASNMPVPSSSSDDPVLTANRPTTILLLPAFTIIENVTAASASDLLTHYISHAPTNTTPLQPSLLSAPATSPNGSTTPHHSDLETPTIPTTITPRQPPPTQFTTRPCPHQYLILLCSQRTRDARCGQSAPLLRKEFERHLRPLGLYRDLQDERPGGVGIYFISHMGGHKFSANVMVYRRAAKEKEGVGEQERNGVEEDVGAAQCIWLARVRPEDCEGIVKFTMLQGKVVKPERQLRGGFDRARGLTSW